MMAIRCLRNGLAAGLLLLSAVAAHADEAVIDRWYAALLKGTLNFTPQTTLLQAVAWVSYVGAVLFLFLRPARPQPTQPTNRMPSASSRAADAPSA